MHSCLAGVHLCTADFAECNGQGNSIRQNPAGRLASGVLTRRACHGERLHTCNSCKRIIRAAVAPGGLLVCSCAVHTLTYLHVETRQNSSTRSISSLRVIIGSTESTANTHTYRSHVNVQYSLGKRLMARVRENIATGHSMCTRKTVPVPPELWASSDLASSMR